MLVLQAKPGSALRGGGNILSPQSHIECAMLLVAIQWERRPKHQRANYAAQFHMSASTFAAVAFHRWRALCEFSSPFGLRTGRSRTCSRLIQAASPMWGKSWHLLKPTTRIRKSSLELWVEVAPQSDFLNLFIAVAALQRGRCGTVSSLRLAEGTRPRGPMDKASAYGAGDCRFESCRGHLHRAACHAASAAA